MSGDPAAPPPVDLRGLTPLRILLATPQPLLGAGMGTTLAGAPGLRPVGEARTGAETCRQCAALQPDVVLLDLRLPDPPAADTVAALRRRCPATRILVLAPPGAVDTVRAALALGATGVVAWDEARDTVVQAVRAVGQGGTWCSAPLLAALARGEPQPPGEALTRRELAVLALLAEGRRNAEIAATLAVSPRTVESHVSHLLAKLGARTRTEALHLAQERGLLGTGAATTAE